MRSQQIPNKRRCMQLLRTCFPLFGSFVRAKDTKARGHVIVLHSLCARDQKAPLSVAGLDLCSRICGVLPIYLVQSSSFVSGMETLATNQFSAGGDVCARWPAQHEPCLHHHLEWLLRAPNEREQCSMRYHVNAVFCPGNGVIHGALGLYSANRHGEHQVGMCLTEHNATIDALLMEI